MPPESAKRPFGATALARFPATVLLFSTRLDPEKPKTPAPSTSLATTEPALLSGTVVRFNVILPVVAIPPPRAAANGRSPLMQVMVISGGQGIPESVAVDGATTFPVTTLSPMTTAAPGPEFAPVGTSSPPPTATYANGLEVFTPPVIVTPSILTVGSRAALSRP